MNQNAPLTNTELDELDQFLMSEATPEECMDLSMLDGFLTALLVGPNTILPSQWLPEVWGETADDPIQFDTQEQAERIISLVMRLMNERVEDLHNGSDEFNLILPMNLLEGQSIPVLDEWCTGFMRGIQMDSDSWEPLMESRIHTTLLFPIMLYGTGTGWEKLKANPELQARHQHFADMLGNCVLGIRDYWLPHRKTAATFRRPEAKVGRNDLCPCGSGKKYKKCCGSGDKLH
jgi:uncharacterized protein